MEDLKITWCWDGVDPPWPHTQAEPWGLGAHGTPSRDVLEGEPTCQPGSLSAWFCDVAAWCGFRLQLARWCSLMAVCASRQAFLSVPSCFSAAAVSLGG